MAHDRRVPHNRSKSGVCAIGDCGFAKRDKATLSGVGVKDGTIVKFDDISSKLFSASYYFISMETLRCYHLQCEVFTVCIQVCYSSEQCHRPSILLSAGGEAGSHEATTEQAANLKLVPIVETCPFSSSYFHWHWYPNK